MEFRIARHTNNLKLIKSFYINILGLELLGDFKNHSYYDGIFIGKPNLNWHLEFSQSKDKANHYFDKDDCLVFYPQTIIEYNSLINTISNNNITFISAKNPYWNQNGKMFLDPDGARIVLSHLRIKK